MQSTLSLLAKEKGHRVRVMDVLSAVEHIFNETAVHARAQATNRLAKANSASHGPRVSPHTQAKARVRKTREKRKENPKEPKVRTKVPKAYTKAETSTAGLSGLENSKSDASSDIQESGQMCTTDTSWNDCWNGDEWNDGCFDEWIDDRSSVGWREGWEQTYDNSVSGGLYVSATSCPKRFERVKMNLDTGAAVNTFPLRFGSEGAGGGRFYRTASGEWILDGRAWQFQGCGEKGLLRSLNGRLTCVHKVLCSAEIARKGRQDFYLGHDGGYMIPIHSKIGQGMRINSF